MMNRCCLKFYCSIDEFLMKAGRSMMSMEEGSKRRPFFSSPDELFDEEYYEEQSPEKKRRLTSEQVGGCLSEFVLIVLYQQLVSQLL